MSAAMRAWQRLAGWWQEREATPAGEGAWAARQIHDNTTEIDGLKAEVARLYKVMDQVTRAVGHEQPDLQKTMPMLRLVGDDREAG